MSKREDRARRIVTQRLAEEVSRPVRERVKAHLDAGRPVKELDIEPNEPPEDKTELAFDVVGHTPKAKNVDSRYRCSWCETEKKFDLGTIVLMTDMKLRLIGPDCWHKYFSGTSFNAAKLDHDLYLRRLAFEEAMAGGLGTEARRYFVELDDLWPQVRDDICKADSFGEKLGRKMPQLYQALSTASRLDGRLQIERRTTQREREIQVETTSASKQRRQTQFKMETVATLHGLNLLVPRHVAEDMKRALAKLEEVRGLLATVKWLELPLREFGTQIKAVESKLSTVFDTIDRVNAVVTDAQRLFARPSLASLRRWARDEESSLARVGKLGIARNSLRLEISHGSLVFVDFAYAEAMKTLPDSPLLRRLAAG